MSPDRRRGLAELIGDLVRIETENPPGNERPGAEFIAGWFGDRGIDARLVGDPYEDRPQVVAEVGDGDPTVVLNGHIDVFPAGDRSRWTHDPYAATVEGGSLYGRGSVDMKTGLALGMLATDHLGEGIADGALNGSITFQAAVGEETAEPGTRRLVERGGVGDYGVVLEATDMVAVTSTTGLAWYRITVRGEPAHAGSPDRGANAVDGARAVARAVDAYDRRVREREHELCGREYATITGFEGGTTENVVPGTAALTVDRRFSPGRTVEEIDAEIDDLVAGVDAGPGIDVEWERTGLYESSEVPADNVVAETFRDRSAAAADVRTEPAGLGGSCDVRNLVNEGGMEDVITWGPGDPSQVGTVDEHINLDDAAIGFDVLRHALRDLLAGEAG